MRLPIRQSLMLGAAWALSSVTIVTISLAVYAMVHDKEMALLYAGAFAVADLVKYLLWPTAREYFDAGRRASAAALAVAATVLAVFSGLATAERFTSDLEKRGALHQAHRQQLDAAQLGLTLAQQDLARLDAEAAKASAAADALRGRGMATPALNLATASNARIDDLRTEARARMERATSQLAELQAQPLPVALPADLAPRLGLGLALVLEVLPALLLVVVRSQPKPIDAQEKTEPTPLPFAGLCRRVAAMARRFRPDRSPAAPQPSQPPASGPAPDKRRRCVSRLPHLTPAIAT